MMTITQYAITNGVHTQILTDHVGFFKVESPSNYYSADGVNYFSLPGAPWHNSAGAEARLPTSLYMTNPNPGSFNIVVITWY